MKAILSILIPLALLPLCHGCRYTPHCIVRLQQVELLDSMDRRVPGDGVLRIDSTTRARYPYDYYSREVEAGSAEYRDRYVAILLHARNQQLFLSIENRASGGALIHWAGVRFIDPFGAVKGVAHSGVNYGTAGELGLLPQAPTRLARGDTFKENLVEDDGAVFDAKSLRWYGRRLLAGLLPESGSLEDVRQAAGAVIGRNFFVVLPIEVEQGMRRYRLTFRIVDTVIVYPGPI